MTPSPSEIEAHKDKLDLAGARLMEAIFECQMYTSRDIALQLSRAAIKVSKGLVDANRAMRGIPPKADADDR